MYPDGVPRSDRYYDTGLAQITPEPKPEPEESDDEQEPMLAQIEAEESGDLNDCSDMCDE